MMSQCPQEQFVAVLGLPASVRREHTRQAQCHRLAALPRKDLCDRQLREVFNMLILRPANGTVWRARGGGEGEWVRAVSFYPQHNGMFRIPVWRCTGDVSPLRGEARHCCRAVACQNSSAIQENKNSLSVVIRTVSTAARPTLAALIGTRASRIGRLGCVQLHVVLGRIPPQRMTPIGRWNTAKPRCSSLVSRKGRCGARRHRTNQPPQQGGSARVGRVPAARRY